MTANGTRSLVFIDDLTADQSSRMNSELYRAILSAQIQPNAAKLIGLRFILQMDNDPKHTAKATQVSQGKEVGCFSMAKSVTCSQPNRACFSLTEDKTEGRKTHKQAAAEGSCSKGLAKHLKGGNSAFGHVHGFQTSGSH